MTAEARMGLGKEMLHKKRFWKYKNAVPQWILKINIIFRAQALSERESCRDLTGILAGEGLWEVKKKRIKNRNTLYLG